MGRLGPLGRLDNLSIKFGGKGVGSDRQHAPDMAIVCGLPARGEDVSICPELLWPNNSL